MCFCVSSVTFFFYLHYAFSYVTRLLLWLLCLWVVLAFYFSLVSELFLILYVTFLFFPILSSSVVLWSYIYISSAFCFHCSFIFFCITLFTIFIESGTLFLLFSLFSTSSATILSSYWFYSLSWSSFFGFFILFVFIRFISDLRIFDVFICSRALFFHVLSCSIVFILRFILRLFFLLFSTFLSTST